jgi:hypothetical protein
MGIETFKGGIEMKKLTAILLISVFVLTSAPAFAEHYETDEAIVADTLILRPIGLAAIVAGTAVFIASLPFALITGSTGKAADSLIVEPVRYTFSRPLGDNYPEGRDNLSPHFQQ